jgi:hypothetical protein
LCSRRILLGCVQDWIQIIPHSVVEAEHEALELQVVPVGGILAVTSQLHIWIAGSNVLWTHSTPPAPRVLTNPARLKDKNMKT